MQIFNANLDILGRLRARRFPFQENVLDIQVDATLDPGATPTTGDRYIISNSAALHANFGTITGVGDDDIVEYTGAAFEIMWDASAEGEGAQAYNEAANSFYVFTTEWTASAAVDERVKVSSNDTVTKYLEDAIVVAQGSNTTNILEVSTLNDGADEDVQIQIDESKINHDNLLGFLASEHVVHTASLGVELSGVNFQIDLLASGGLKLTGNEVGVEPADFAGTGLEDDGSDNLRLAAQGNGIAGGAGSTLSVDPATEVAGSRAAVYVAADGVGVDVDDSTLTHSSSTLQVKDGGIGATQLATGVLDRYSSATHSAGAAVVVNHALGLSSANACHVSMFDVSSGEHVFPDSITFTDGNNLTLNFAVSVGANSLRININSAEDIT